MITIHNRTNNPNIKINFTSIFFLVTGEGVTLVVEKTKDKVFLQTGLKEFPPTQSIKLTCVHNACVSHMHFFFLISTFLALG